MGAFPNPFAGNVSRKMSNAELMQALRFDISGELEAIFLYDAHYHATDDPAAKAILADIRDEEKVHVGELITLMRYLDPHEAECFLEGEAEVHEMLEKLGISPKNRLKNLSKGNKEKVCLILVMSRNAKLYVLDEPIAGVDPAARDYVISTIINNYNPEATVVISTHLIADIEQILDEVIFLKNGEIVLQKTVDEIRTEHEMSVDGLFREVFRW